MKILIGVPENYSSNLFLCIKYTILREMEMLSYQEKRGNSSYPNYHRIYLFICSFIVFSIKMQCIIRRYNKRSTHYYHDITSHRLLYCFLPYFLFYTFTKPYHIGPIGKE